MEFACLLCVLFHFCEIGYSSGHSMERIFSLVDNERLSELLINKSLKEIHIAKAAAASSYGGEVMILAYDDLS